LRAAVGLLLPGALIQISTIVKSAVEYQDTALSALGAGAARF
jgi:hypothetical protein